jgi:hypothetical protein
LNGLLTERFEAERVACAVVLTRIESAR